MKKVIALLLTLLGLTLVLAACTDGQEPSQDDHKHTFESTWLYDENQHWHPAACEHTEQESDRGDHVDADGNDICDTCGYIKDHVHSFEEKWTWDANTHFHKSACGHNVKSDEAAHADDNNDAVCDVCTYDYDHTHTYDEAWSSTGENGHWHAPTCGHTVDGSELAAHVDENNDGACDVCGETGGHEHTYAETWTTTDDEHWREVTCGHNIPVADKGVHKTEDGDTTCDICGFTPEHFHTFADTLSSDDVNHWYASTCGHDVKKEETPHSGHEEDGVCDVCSHVVFRRYTVTVSVPAYMTVIAPNGQQTDSFLVRENTPVSFTVSVPDFAEIVRIDGARQDGKPTADGKNRMYSIVLDGLTADHTVSVIGNKLSIVEMIVSDGMDSIPIEGMFVSSIKDITFTAPSAGRYMIFSTSQEDLQFGLGEKDEDGYPIYEQVYFMDITEPCEFTVQACYFPWSVPDGGKLDFTYIVAKVEDEITLSSLKADGYTLPTNVNVTVHFTAPKAGKYQISSSTLGMVWNDYVCDSIVLTATEDNQPMSFTVCYRNTTVPTFNFDCNIVSLEATPLELGDNTVTAPYGSYYAVSFTAPHAGSFLIQSASPYFDFYTWNDESSSMTIEGNSYTMNSPKEGSTVVLFVTVDIYDYDGTDDITDVISITSIGHLPPENNGVYSAQVGVNNCYINTYDASDFVLSVSNGDQISVDGGANWYTSVQVTVPANGIISYMVHSASDANTVNVTVQPITYEFTLHVGTQTQTMVPGKEYTVYLTGSADTAFYVNYILNWTDADVVVYYNNAPISSGTTILNYADGYALVVVYNGATTADITFTLDDPSLSSGDNEDPNMLVLGENSFKVTVDVENNICLGTTVTFTVPADGSYILSAADGEANAIVKYQDTAVTLPYTFTSNKGDVLTFTVATTATATLTEDTIDLTLNRVSSSEDLSAELNGTYSVNFVMTGMYVLTFNNGLLTVKDNNNFRISGTYKYTYNEIDGVIVTKTDGTPCDIVIAFDDAGNMTFKCTGLPTPQILFPS